MITSTSNPKIKELRLLQKARERQQKNLFLIEGLAEIKKAAKAGYKFVKAFYQPELISHAEVTFLINEEETELHEVSKKVYDSIAYRENSGGLIICATPRYLKLSDISLSNDPLLLVLEGVEKPGNLGALLRTADAAGIDAVLLSDNQTELYNPNVIRASIGCVFTVPTVVTDNDQCIEWLNQKDIKIYCAALTASQPYTEIDFKGASAIVMGTESTGLTNQWLGKSTQNIVIPMRGQTDSMNVSTSAAVIVFEAVRQRTT